jgi:hypothetical protein
MDWPLTLRPLPRPVAPVRDETITSYLTRLAEANRLDPAGLRHLLTGSNRKDADVPFASLAAITGRPPMLLAYAMPQLCTPHERAHVGVEHVHDRGPAASTSPAAPAPAAPPPAER